MGVVKSLGYPDKKWVDPKNASIEAQVAVYSLTERMVAKLEVPEDLQYAVDWWCRNALKDYLGVQSGLGVKQPTIKKENV